MLDLRGSDVLSQKGWKSTQIRIAGVCLGMQRVDALIAAQRAGFDLVQGGQPTYNLKACSDSSDCYLDRSLGYDSEGIHFLFGSGGGVEEIDIRISPTGHRGTVLRSLKGLTRRFFNSGYSDRLRLELFGPTDKREAADGGYSPKADDIRYFYPVRGIVITVSPNPMTAPIFDLESFSLIPPATHSQYQ
jgi:hypothetical protein